MTVINNQEEGRGAVVSADREYSYTHGLVAGALHIASRFRASDKKALYRGDCLDALRGIPTGPPPSRASLRPFVKWAGGKRQLMDVLNATAPAKYGRYYEPFIGGGAFLFSRLPESATISDVNPELINCYQVVRDDVKALIRRLRLHKNEEEHFYAVRAENPADMTPAQRAARFIYLNKSCFNGLYRENKSGRFNVPFGRYENPKIVDKENLLAISAYLQSSDLEIHCGGYQTVLDRAQAGDFVYFDPPYVPMTKTASFANYVKGGFGLGDQAELAKVFADLTTRRVQVMLSNSNTQVIRDLYKEFNIQTIYATRAINCKGGKRGKEANEVLVTNYQIPRKRERARNRA